MKRMRPLLSASLIALVAPLTTTRLHAQFAPNEQTARVLRLERFVVPEFPPFLRQSGVMQGTVVVALGHEARGPARDMLVLESTDARFTDAALDAIREWRFEAPTKRAESDSASTEIESTVSVVRFLFTTGSVSVVPLAATAGQSRARRAVRAETPIELPNFAHLDQTPKPLHVPQPEFPAALRGRVASGTVVVKYFIDSEGRVRLPAIVTATAPEFAHAALTAIRQWRFEPPRIDGKPVISLERHSFQFGAMNP